MICIVANVLVMCLTYAGEPEQWMMDLFVANSFFTFVFGEVIAKITALGVVNYFEDPWNGFDFTVVGFPRRFHRNDVHGRERGVHRDAARVRGGEVLGWCAARGFELLQTLLFCCRRSSTSEASWCSSSSSSRSWA